jgi:thioredoxin reductase (NADPH)
LRCDERIVIIGAGPAGCAAAVQCKRLGVEPRLLDRTGRAGGLIANAHRVENYPGLEPSDGPTFVARLQAHIARFGIEVVSGTVTGLEASPRRFVVRDSSGTLTPASVILAVGTTPLPLEIPGARDLRDDLLFYEVRDVLTAHRTPRHVLVIGGGEAALDYALTLARAGARVTILVRGDGVQVCRPLVEGVSREPAIRVLSRRETVSLKPAVAAIGRRSAASSLLRDVACDARGHAVTLRGGLYLAGDARSGTLGQVGMAVGDGLAAAAAAVNYVRATHEEAVSGRVETALF